MAAPVTYYTLPNFFSRGVHYDDLDSTLQNDVLSAQCIIPLDITALREIASDAIQALAEHGGILAVDSAPKLERVNGATGRCLRVTWTAEADTDEVAFPPIPWPPDLDPSENVVVHLLLAREGTTDDCDIDVLAYENSTGAYAPDTEMGGKTAALDGAAGLVTEVTVTLSASNIAGPPGVLNLSLVPDAHEADDLYLYSAWIEYSRMLRTS